MLVSPAFELYDRRGHAAHVERRGEGALVVGVGAAPREHAARPRVRFAAAAGGSVVGTRRSDGGLPIGGGCGVLTSRGGENGLGGSAVDAANVGFAVRRLARVLEQRGAEPFHRRRARLLLRIHEHRTPAQGGRGGAFRKLAALLPGRPLCAGLRCPRPRTRERNLERCLERQRGPARVHGDGQTRGGVRRVTFLFVDRAAGGGFHEQPGRRARRRQRRGRHQRDGEEEDRPARPRSCGGRGAVATPSHHDDVVALASRARAGDSRRHAPSARGVAACHCSRRPPAPPPPHR